MNAGDVPLVLVMGATALAGSIRWLRVAQREHYLAGSSGRFAWRWWRSGPVNAVLGLLAIVGLAGAWSRTYLGWLGLAAAVGPVGLAWRGRSTRLALTRRLARLAVATSLLVLAAVAAALATRRPVWAVGALVGLPWVVDAALLLLDPIEHRLGDRWVARAAAKLAASGARVVAITGSFGKTTTKAYVAHLLSSRFATVSSPASFNNRMGLARAVNEHLNPSTEVFVAEMGTYGRGEIAELCGFVPPEVGVIAAIGPVHLERFGSEAAIVAAKSEILAGTRLAVINVDHPLTAALAASWRGPVARVSGIDPKAEVAVVEGALFVAGHQIAPVGDAVFGSNLAAAVAVARYFGIPEDVIVSHLNTLPAVAHRRQLGSSERGFTIIDDTYNSNPAGAAAAVDLLARQPGAGRRVVVTPGMIELGPRQADENRRFAAHAARVASDLVVVGSSNRRALLQGAEEGSAAVTVVRSRDEAVAWVRSRLGPGDAVLYENDLPDHYP